ncbi:MAG: S-methyl-5'-thioinosine phosphorylase [Gammaproteobacteria bacterium]|nr:S-methyl-5'-thioinosine phosphorylase [Gammaproteobacteria bacterium]
MFAHAVIIGSGSLTLAADFTPLDVSLETRYGGASARPLVGLLGSTKVMLLARHGIPHRIAPHAINYRANLAMLQTLGIERIVAVNTVGGIAPEAKAGVLIVPDQIIDYSWGREQSFSDSNKLYHVDFSSPYDRQLGNDLADAAQRARLDVIVGGVYGCTQGPRFETPAEINRMDSDGCTVVGMTGMPEAGLARELGIPYACVCLVVNPAAGRDGDSIDLDAIAIVSRAGMERVGRLLVSFFEGLEGLEGLEERS